MMYIEEQSIDIPRTLLGQHFLYYIDRFSVWEYIVKKPTLILSFLSFSTYNFDYISVLENMFVRDSHLCSCINTMHKRFH